LALPTAAEEISIKIENGTLSKRHINIIKTYYKAAMKFFFI
jgi:hypothetical protein